MPDCKAFVAGCAGTVLTDEERRFLAQERPWGLILFKRNVSTPEALSGLTAAFRACVGRGDAPVLIDQEGGRVQRLGPPHWRAYPAAAVYGTLRQDGSAAAGMGGRLIAADLRRGGITVDCAPVLDLPVPGSHQVIGSRAFGTEPGTVVALARAFAEGLLAGGVLPVIKHVPGHGRAGVDSHLELPAVHASRAELAANDFAPFKELADLPLAMTAHVVFTALDDRRPATLSPRVVDEVIRGHIGFSGLLLTDDLSMEALRGTLGERAEAAVAAGCDMLLHCNGKLDEARQVADAALILADEPRVRAERALARVAGPVAPIADDLPGRFTAMLEAVA